MTTTCLPHCKKIGTSPGPAFQEYTESYHENVPAPKAASSDLQSTDGLTVLARIEIVAILVHYQPSYNTSQTMKPSDPLCTAGCIQQAKLTSLDSQHLAIPGFPQSDHTVGKPRADVNSLCNEAKQTSRGSSNLNDPSCNCSKPKVNKKSCSGCVLHSV